MATLADTMETDMLDVVLNTDEHAVPIVYTPLSTGTPRSIDAIIDPNEDAGIIQADDGREIARSVDFVIYSGSASTGVLRPVAADQLYVNRSTHPLYQVVYKVNTNRPDGHGAHYGTAVVHDNFEKAGPNFRINRGR